MRARLTDRFLEMSTLRVIYYVAVSLDGFVAPADGRADWLVAYNAGNEDYGIGQLCRSVDALIEGSKTYEQSLDFRIIDSESYLSHWIQVTYVRA